MSAIREDPPAVPPPTGDEGKDRQIWIDLDNSPHVPFFLPVIEELKRRGFRVLLTARDTAQVAELIRYHGLDCGLHGRHYGKNKVIKVLGIGLRALQLAPLILRNRPVLALSHGSRSQVVLSSFLGVPSLVITDYEHAKLRMGGIGPKWIMVPEIIRESVAQAGHARVLTYPGIKEDVYVPFFRPSPGIREQLGLPGHTLLVTIRPPASDAHYHNPASDDLFRNVVDFLALDSNVRMVMLPRNKNQKALLGELWPELLRNGRIVIPEQVLDGLNLIWFSDLVISGGGTMNREAAALGVPVYSIFRGKPASVDRYLAEIGRLTSLENVEDVKTIPLTRRIIPSSPNFRENKALASIIENVTALAAPTGHPTR